MNKEQSISRENELLIKTAVGDENAFRELYDLTNKAVYFYLYRLLKDRESAEDVQIDVFTQVWKGAKKFKGKSKVTTWIFGIARNLAMNELRKRKYHVNIDDYPEMTQDNSTDQGPDLEAMDQKKIIKNAMSKISSKHQEVLDLVFFHEMNYQEISDTLHVSVNTVKTRVFYAKSAFKKKLKQLRVYDDDI